MDWSNLLSFPIPDIQFIQSVYVPPVLKIPSGLQRRRIPKPIFDYLDVVEEFTESATIYIDIQASGVDVKETTDAATIYIDIQNMGGECYSTFSGQMFGEGEATARWLAGAYQVRWSGDVQERWVLSELSTESGC